MMKRWLCCSLFLFAIVGCNRSPNGADSSPTNAGATGVSSDASPDTPASQDATKNRAGDPPTKELTATVASWSEIEQFLKSQKNKIVVADVWSTSCIPCMRELPHLFELQKRNPEDVIAVTINIDYAGLPDETPDDAKTKALEFLQQHDAADTKHFVSSTPDEDVLKALDIPSVPAVLVFDRSGKRVRMFGLDGEEFDYAKSVIPYVSGLLEGGSAGG